MTILSDEFVDLPTSSGVMRTHLFRPAGEGRFPAIVLYSEIYQATAPIRRTATFLAGHGYVVAVPEVYHDFLPPCTVLNYDQVGTDVGNDLKTKMEISGFDADTRVLLDFLKSHAACNGRLGVMGICLGGHLSYRAAAQNPDVAAAVCFYATDIHKGSLGKGAQDGTLELTGQIKGELLMVWGRQDPHVPLEGRRLIQARLEEECVCYSWHEFNAQHAFVRDEGHRYDPELAQHCYSLSLSLFRRRLG